MILSTALSIYYLLHSVLASERVKRVLTNQYIAPRYYRLCYNCIAIILLLPIVWWYLQMEKRWLMQINMLQYLGVIVAGIGCLSLYLALRQYDLGEFIGTRQFKEEEQTGGELKTDGFNAYVRHPLYFSGLLILWGWFMVQPTDAYLLVALISTAYLYFGTLSEERKLVTAFGQAYKTYQKEVPMLLPLPKKKHQN